MKARKIVDEMDSYVPGRSQDEIAEEFGYENESKFSAAFKKIMGDSPGVYRKEHSKIKII